MTAMLINGKQIAKEVREALKVRVAALQQRGITPGLAVVLTGDDPASAVYVRNKTKACQGVGIAHFDHILPATTTQAELLSLVDQLNADPRVHGILVQLPLPTGLDAPAVLERIDPRKDADGFHPQNVGRLVSGHPTFVACTPKGVLHLLRSAETPLSGATAVVVGRSNIVGKPMAHLLLQAHCTVTVAHSRTRALPEVVGAADILVAAIGRAELIKGAWIKEGATVIDVGINRLDDRLVGDVEFAAAATRARAITPVPGGVGPMTIAMLLENTVWAVETYGACVGARGDG